MLDIFLYNENMCFVNINFNLLSNLINYFDSNFDYIDNIIFFENYYFDNIFFKNKNKNFYTWTTTADISYFDNFKIDTKSILLSHEYLYYNSYIFWNVQKMHSLFYLDFLLKNIFIFFNFSKNNTFIIYDNINTFWDFIYDEYSQISFFNLSLFNLNYYTIFDFKKHFIGVNTMLLHKKLAMLYHYSDVKHFSLFLVDSDFEIFSIFQNLNFEIFGVFFFKYLDFLKFKFLKNYNINYFFIDNFLLFNYSYFLKEKLGLIYFFYDSHYFEYVFLFNFLKLDIFFNTYYNNILINYNFNSLIDTSMSNIHLYGCNDNLLPVYCLQIKKNGEFFNEMYLDNYKNYNELNYYFIVESDNYLIFLLKYFHLYNLNLNLNYYYYFYDNLLISKFINFEYLEIIFWKMIIGLIMCGFFFFYYIYINIIYYFIFKNFELKFIINYIYKCIINYIYKFIINYIYKFLIFFLIFLILNFKNNKIFFINKDFLMQKPYYNKGLLLNFYNFDLVLFIYNKFIITNYGYKYQKYFMLLRIENLINDDFFFNQKKKSYNFIYKFLFFLLLMYYYLILIKIYIYLYNNYNLSKLITLYNYYYCLFFRSFINNYLLKLNLDGSYTGFQNWTVYYTLKLYYKFFQYLIEYFINLKFINMLVYTYIKNNKRQKILKDLYSNLNDVGFFFFWKYSTKFIALLHKRDIIASYRYFFIYKFFYEIKYFWKDYNLNIILINILNIFSIFEFKVGHFFFNLNIFSCFDNIYIFDYSLFDLLKLKYNNNISSNIYINLEFENFIFKPLNKFLKYVYFNNIFFIILFNTLFLKYLIFEIYLKFLFFYFFNIIYYLYIIFLNKSFLKIFNFTVSYYFIININKVKYIILILHELFINKFIILLWIWIKKFKILIILNFLIIYFFNFNLFHLSILINSFFFLQNYIYIFFIFFELINYIFENLFIYNIFNYFLKKINYFIIWNDINIYFLNYKIFIFSWLKLLKEYYLNFEYMSVRKAYHLTFKFFLFKEYKESLNVIIPFSYIHTVVRLFYIIIYNKDPESWIYGLHYFSFFYRLGWDFLGQYVSKGDKFNLFDHIFQGFFWDSIYHKYYLGYDFNNLLLYYNFLEFRTFFSSKLYYFLLYLYLYSYFIFEFFFFKIVYFFILNFKFLFYYLYIYIVKQISIILNISIYYLLISYYSIIYIYFLYFDFFIEKLYIFLYTFFFFNIFLNFFLFFYNFFIYYNETLFNFLNMDIDFIKQNIFNYKYRLTEDMHPLGTWPTYVYKFEQYTWIDNIFKEYFLRNLFFYELKNLYFFKTFYSFYMNINRITFFFLIIYLFILYRLCQYFLIFLNKWFYFTFFNNDWSISRNPELSWDKWILYTKKKSYYFNEGLTHIIGGNIIWNYYYYYNNNLDSYIYNQKNQYLYPEKEYDIDNNLLKLKKKNTYNNNLFFQNQLLIINNLWKNNLLKDNYWNWYINSLFFFKNYQFLWYKNFEFIIFKYENLYGSFSRPWIDKHNSTFIKPLNIDKYNYLFLPPNARVTYTHLFTKEWLFYKNFKKNERYIKYKKRTNLNLSIIKLINYDELYNFRLQYPFLMFWITSKNIKIKKNCNLKYLFPFLIPKKEIWLLYKDLFFIEKDKVKDLATVPMSAEWLTFFNKSLLLPYLSIFSKLDFNLAYNFKNYKGIWNSVNDNSRDLFLNYKGWESRLVKYPNLNDMLFYTEFKLIDKFEFNYYNWLLSISKRYFNYFMPVFHTNNWLTIPHIYEQNLFKNLKYRSYDFDFDWREMDELGTLSYIAESHREDPLEPYTPEEWSDILRSYTQNAFFLGDDGILLMHLYRHYVVHNVVSTLNFIYGFSFFFIPFYTFILGTEIYWELSSGFIFQGGLRQPVDTGRVHAGEYYLSMSDYDMRDERYFYINIIEQEILDLLIRFYQEIFYVFTKYFNNFNYFSSIKKNNILLNEDMMMDYLYDYRIYHNGGRLFKSYAINDSRDEFMEEQTIRFLMQERKSFYTFSDLSYNLPFFDTKNNNMFLLFYNFTFFKTYISELKFYNLIIFDLFKFFENTSNNLELNNSLNFYKNLYKNKQNLLDFVYFYIKNINNDNLFFINLEKFFNNFFYFYFNKNKEFTIWFDKYFNWQNKYKKVLFYQADAKPKPLLPLYIYNSYIDVTGPYIKIYKTMTKTNMVYNQLNTFKNIYNLNDYTNNYIKLKLWQKVADEVLLNNFILPARTFLYTIIDIDWFVKIKYLPITSTYLKNFDGSYLFLNKYFLSNYIKTFNLINNQSILYIDKSAFFIEKKKIWQFSLLLNDYSNLTFFPFFEFLLLLLLLVCFLIIIYIYLYNRKVDYSIYKYTFKKIYYDKINNKWVYFNDIKK